MANVTVSTSLSNVTVTATPSNITVTEGNSFVANIVATTTAVNVSSNVYTVAVAPLTEVSNSTIRNAISANDAGGYGSFTYNPSTGVFTYTGPSDSDIRQTITVNDTGGLGSLTYSNTTGVFTYAGPSETEFYASLSVTDEGGYGALYYDNTTGVFTFQGILDSEIRATFGAINGITYNPVTGVIGQALTTDDITEGDNQFFTTDRANAAMDTYLPVYTGNISATNLDISDSATFANTNIDSLTAESLQVTGTAQFDGNVNIDGNLTVTGNVDYVTVQDLLVKDKSITVNYGNPVAATSYIYVDRSGSGYGNAFISWQEGYGGTGLGAWLFRDNSTTRVIPRTTTDLSEGTNLYYTTGRANAAIIGFTGTVVGAYTFNNVTTFNNTITAKGSIVANSNVTMNGNVSITGNLDGNSRNQTFTVGTYGTGGVDTVIIGNVTLDATAKSLDVDALNGNVTISQSDFNAANANIIVSRNTSVVSGNISTTVDKNYNIETLSSSSAFTVTMATSGQGGFITLDDGGVYKPESQALTKIQGSNFRVDTNNIHLTASGVDNGEFTITNALGNVDIESTLGVVNLKGRVAINPGVDAGYEFPTSDGEAGQALLTHGNGYLYFGTIAGDISSITAGDGLTGGGASGDVTLTVGAGLGITVNPDNVAVDMSAFSTTDLAEGDNLYFTTDRANSAIDAYVANGDISADEVGFTPDSLWHESILNVQAALDDLQIHKLDADALTATVTYFPTTANSNVSGYLRQVTSTTDPDYNTTEVNISTGAITTSNQLLANLISDPNTIIGDTGLLEITTLGAIRKTAGGTGQSAQFYFEVYHRDSAGTETLLGRSANTEVIDSAIYSLYSERVLIENANFEATDRVVTKFYGNNVGAGAPEYEFRFGGTQPVRTLFPVPISVIPTNVSATTLDVNTAPFSGILSSADDTAQKAFETIDAITTTVVPEGDNLYFTTDRANSAMDAYLVSTTANVDSVNGQTGAVNLNTDQISEGDNNYYFSNVRVDGHLNTGTASNDQVLSWSGTDYVWVDQSGGGGTYGDSNVTTLLADFGSNSIATTGNVSAGNVITDDIRGNGSNNIHLHTGDKVIVTEQFHGVETYTGNINGDGYAVFADGEYNSGSPHFTYTGNVDLNGVFIIGDFTAGSNAMVVSDLIFAYDFETPASFSDVLVNMVYDLGLGTPAFAPFGAPAHVTEVDAANSIIRFSENALSTGTVEALVWPGAVDSTTGWHVALFSDLDLGGSDALTIALDQPQRLAYGYPESGPVISNFDLISHGINADYSLDDLSNLCRARTGFIAPKTAFTAPGGLLVGNNADMSNRAENDSSRAFGVNVLWDGTDTTYGSGNFAPITQMLLKQYTDGAAQATYPSSAGPRLLFSSVTGSALDDPFTTYPRAGQEMGRITWWGPTGTSLSPTTYNPPAMITAIANNDWTTANASKIDVYMTAKSSTGRADAYLAYQNGRLTLASRSGANQEIQFAPSQTGASLNVTTAYAAGSKIFANVAFADVGSYTGSKFTVTNGQGDYDVGDQVISLKRADNGTGLGDKEWTFTLAEASDNLVLAHDGVTHATFSVNGDVVFAGNVSAANITGGGGGGGAVDSVNGQTGVVVLDTDDIAEGNVNLYYTDARANAAMDAYLTSTTANVDSVNGQTATVVLTTDNIDEGSSNLYFSNARVTSAITGNSVTLKQFAETVVSVGTVSGDISSNLDVSTGSIFQVTTGGALTINSLTNAVAGTSATIIVTQGATPGTLSSTMKFAGGSKTLSTTTGDIDIISVFYDGTTYYATLSKGYA